MLITFFVLLIFSCVKAACPSNWSLLNSTSMLDVQAYCFSYIQADTLSTIPADACSAMSAEQISDLNWYFTDICKGFTKECISALPLKTVSGIDQNCIPAMRAAAFSGFTPAQVKFLDPQVFQQARAYQLTTWSAQCASISGTDMSYMMPDEEERHSNKYNVPACKGLNPGCLSLIPDESFANITRSCYETIISDNCNALPAEALQFIPSTYPACASA